jgi:hypothetical protein
LERFANRLYKDNLRLVQSGLADRQENDNLREAIRQMTFAHHEDRDYCGPCRFALKTFGLLPE